MANIRLKKTESTSRQKNVPEEVPPSKDESFLDNSGEDELTRKRKMILTGITAGVGVAGVTAAGLLFFGPYSPFGAKPPEKRNNVVSEQSLPLPPVEDKTKVQVPPPVVKEPAKTAVAVQPLPTKEKIIAVAPVTPIPTEKPKIKKEKPVAIAPSPKESVVNSFGPSSYNYDVRDGGPIVEIPSKKKITVSRDPNFNKIYLNGNSNFSGKYRISIPPPGDIYWKEEGKSAHKITINPPVSSGIQADFPAQVKLNETLSWSATGKISFYRVEVASDADFLNKVKVFSTNKTSLPIENIGQGKWFIRISALNLQSGSWDSTRTFPVNVGDLSTQIAPVEAPPAPEQVQEAPKEESKEENTALEKLEDNANKPVEPIEPVEATVPETQQVSPQTGE